MSAWNAVARWRASVLAVAWALYSAACGTVTPNSDASTAGDASADASHGGSGDALAPDAKGDAGAPRQDVIGTTDAGVADIGTDRFVGDGGTTDSHPADSAAPEAGLDGAGPIDAPLGDASPDIDVSVTWDWPTAQWDNGVVWQ